MSVFRKQTSRKGSVVYEEVLQKNFQIIQTFLKKFHQIFTKQEQFQQHLNKFAQRFAQYDDVLDQFRQQQKMNIVMLQKKVNNMKSSVRQSHRGSHRFSKINIPIFQSVQSAQGGKNYTLLKFDSIDNCSTPSEQKRVQIKPAQQQSVFSSKQYDEMQQSLSNVKEQIFDLKQKVSFLSAYTSSMSSNENSRTKTQSIKKQILSQIQSQAKNQIQKQIQTHMIDTQKVFLQQINNLAIQFSDQVKQIIQNRFQKSQSYLKQLEIKSFTKDQSLNLSNQFNKQLKLLANQCINMFAKKQETSRSIVLLEKKFKNLELSLKQQFHKSQTEKQQAQYFQSLIQVNSNINISNNQDNSTSNHPFQNKRVSTSKHKNHKSQSQFIKHHIDNGFNCNIDQDESKKQNMHGKSERFSQNNKQICKDNNFLSKGALFTSKVSKEFMKNFGLHQNKLVKNRYQTFYNGNSQKKLYNQSVLNQKKSNDNPNPNLRLSSYQTQN